MKTLLLSCTVLTIFSAGLMAQDGVIPCYNDHVDHDVKMANDPDFARQYKEFQSDNQKYLDFVKAQKEGAAYKTQAVKILPVVFHVFSPGGSSDISDAQVEDQIRIFNEDFAGQNPQVNSTPAVGGSDPTPWFAFKPLTADAGIEFRLAQLDPSGNMTNGIIHHQSSAEWVDAIKATPNANWPKANYLNIWCVPTVAPPGAPAGKILGYADVDGIIVRSDQVGSIGTAANAVPVGKGSTVTHEVAHMLGLLHIWGITDCGDDNISDTPPHATSWNGNCPTKRQNALSQDNVCSQNPNAIQLGNGWQIKNGSTGDMFMNFMDYSICRYMFTAGQGSRMKVSSRLGNWSSVSNLHLTGVFGTGVEDPSDKGLVNFNIFPNPTEQYTTVSFLLRGTREVKITVFDVLGKQLKDTEYGVLPEGVHSLNLGPDVLTKPGIYLVRLELDGVHFTKKLMVN